MNDSPTTLNRERVGMRYVLGVDGGQTITTAVVADETGCLLGIGQGGPAGQRNGTDGASRVQKALADAMQGAVRMADLENARIAAACVGLPDDTPATETLCKAIMPTPHLIFGANARIALYSVTFGQPGVVVRAGTSASAYGVNARGKQAQSGGWGELLGDEGSGYWIAMRALNACCRAQDGIAPSTQLLPLLLKHLDVPDLHAARLALHSEAWSPSSIAGMAEIVSRAAAQGDKTAKRILRETGRELALSAQAVLRQLGLEQEPVTVGTVGGVFRAGRAVLRTFREMVKQTAPNATIAPARVPPAVGAALIALEALEVPLNETLCANLEIGLSRLTVAKA